ncbi:tetratricopeptide repeat-containing diguanylate cyclase [Cognaticolwellia mytili]|uniref:tetratricopeptide repeat-containing diguanylate cyclase n=1 Tax=Cognaticolwellia mytili TaxID=1888913 RepID=UPI000A16E11A|nr:GGDEF domain-containing protein [Cognaticolwellia mytili]
MNRYFTSQYFIIFFVVQLLVSVAVANDSSGQKQTVNESAVSTASQKNATENFPIDQKVLALKRLSEHDAVSAHTEMQRLQEMDLELNQAEYYLLYLAQANIENVKGKEDKVIHWLNKAITLEVNLSERQMNLPDFASAYLMLANIYHRQGLYQKAFDSKKKYIKKYARHLKLRNELRVKRLSKKYKMAKKLEQNELLEQAGELKRLEMARIESQRNKHNLYIAITLLAGLLFFLLLLRQLKIRRALKMLAKTDRLTGLANRRAFFSNGFSYMESALKVKSELCVLVVSIDHFKKLNDKLGDGVGDDIICHIAALVSEVMRSRDILARIADAEFAAILPDANIGQARAIAERIREKVQHDVKKGLEEDLVSVSIGLASINDTNDSFDDLLHLAGIACSK